MNSITFLRLNGSKALTYLEEISRLRIEVFREFPYLYDGHRAYEEDYLESYFSCPKSLVVLAIDGTRVIGAATGLPLVDAEPAWQQAFSQSPYTLESVFYFGESVLEKSYRHRGIGHRFFDEREGYAQSLPGIRYTAFSSVLRPEGHPRRPTDYRSHDVFWTKRGYTKVSTIKTEFSWKDLDEMAETPKPMEFWLRPLANSI